MERLMTTHEVAQALGIHVNTVKRLPPSELPYYRMLRRGDRRYEPADVIRYLAERKVGREDPHATE